MGDYLQWYEKRMQEMCGERTEKKNVSWKGKNIGTEEGQ